MERARAIEEIRQATDVSNSRIQTCSQLSRAVQAMDALSSRYGTNKLSNGPGCFRCYLPLLLGVVGPRTPGGLKLQTRTS